MQYVASWVYSAVNTAALLAGRISDILLNLSFARRRRRPIKMVALVEGREGREDITKGGYLKGIPNRERRSIPMKSYQDNVHTHVVGFL